MAGGKGSRISELFPDIPKPLIPIDGIPVLERELISLRDQGFQDIIITVSHLKDKIIEYFGDGSGISPTTGKPFDIRIEYFEEDVPLGNAGALFKLKDKLTEDFLLLNADAVFDIDFQKFVKFHKEHGGLVTIFTHPNSHPYDSGLVVANSNHQVESWLIKEENRPRYYHNRVNAGLHVLSPQILENFEIDSSSIGRKDKNGVIIKVDLDRNILKPLAGSGRMYCYDSPEYVKDMGTPQRFKAVEADYINGVIRAKNLRHPQKAIFLDRDGTINKYIGFLRSPAQFELIPGVAEAIKRINQSGYLAIVVTNQPVIARGEVTIEGLDLIHKKMETFLGKEGAFLDGVYFCPHHPDKGFEGEVPELKINCECRKPKAGLFRTAAEDLNIDLSKSYMIGDSDIDVEAGKRAGCKSLKIDQNRSYALLEAVNAIITQ